jgi:hypothetical protein
MTRRLSAVAALVLAAAALADEPLASGPEVGRRPMPYAFVLATGPDRGTAHCYVCDTADKPAAVVFARSLSDPLGKLAARLDQAAADAVVPEFRGWLTLLTAGPQPDAEDRLAAWGRKHAVRQLPLGVFDDEVGPPAYRLSKQADVTVVLFVRRQTVATFAFKPGELTGERVEDVMKALGTLKQ